MTFLQPTFSAITKFSHKSMWLFPASLFLANEVVNISEGRTPLLHIMSYGCEVSNDKWHSCFGATI